MKRFYAGYIKGIMGLAILLGTQLPGMGQVPNATYHLQVTSPTQNSYSPGTLSSANSSVTIGNTPAPSINAYSTIYSPSYGDLASGSMTYYFEYLGAAGSLPINIDYELAYTGDYNTFGSVNCSLNLLNVDNIAISNYAGNLPSQDIRGTFHDTLSTNTVYELDLSAYTQAQGDGSNIGARSTAMVDPVISIDPSFAGDPNSYSLVTSSGTGNSTVPEPGVAVNLILAAGLLLLRRQRPAAL